MPVPLLAEGFGRGLANVPYLWSTLKIAPWVVAIYLAKIYFGGATCQSERVMHGKVVMITGGTSGIGAEVVRDLATRGAQIVLLTHHAPTDMFLVDYIEDLRTSCNNELIYAEQVDLASLHSIRTFATKWVDNAPPRRLDAIILCAATMTPYWGKSAMTIDGLEQEWMVNYVSAFQLLSILSPALRAQPADRDVRILFSTCNSYINASFRLEDTESAAKSGSFSHARAKLATMNFAMAFQKHLDAYQRPDKQPNNARVLVVDPGFCRTPGARRWLSGGSLLGLLIYLLTWPLWWLIMKSAMQGAQSYLFAIMEAEYGRGPGGKIIKECREITSFRPEVNDEKAAKTLWETTDKQIERLEKQSAVKRALEKKEAEEREKQSSKPGQIATVKPEPPTASGAQNNKTTGSRRSRKE